MIRAQLVLLAFLTLVVFVADGCPFGSDDGGTGGPTSTCLYGYGSAGTAEDFGTPCANDADCAHGECMTAGADGNITNNIFSFCTRGCDCENSEDAKVTSAGYSCVYPGGCDIGASQGGWRYVVPTCTTLADCQAIDSRYTHCQSTDQANITDGGCGQLDKVCQARQ